MTTNANKHLTEDERRIIQTGIENNSTKAAIAKTLGKDKSTIGKEIRNHRTLAVKCRLPVECSIYAKCKPGRDCVGASCPNYVPFTCSRRDRSPGACNGCPSFSSCHFNKYLYKASQAHQVYREVLSDSRAGANLTSEEAARIVRIVKPLLDQGQSPYMIIRNHPELNICEHTLYNYIDNDTLHYAGGGVTVMDLRQRVSRRSMPKKNRDLYKKREDRKYLVGRTHQDLERYLKENPDASIVQMDTVYNDLSNGPFIQTFKFMQLFPFFFAILHDERTVNAMTGGIDTLEQIMSPALFRKYVSVLKTDRGPEFQNAEGIESRDGVLRTRVFYCDPMQSCQKGSLENNHIMLRYICPKAVDLRAIGLTSQDKLNLALSHINSAPKEALNGKSPLQIMEFLDPDLFARFYDFGIRKIEGDKVILKPYLLK